MKIYINGQFIQADQAALSVHDAAVQHAVGLFETMQAFNGKVYRLSEHLQRLIDSAAQLGLTQRLQGDALAQLVNMTLTENGLEEARIRLMITGGDLSLLGAARGETDKGSAHQPGVICVASPPTEYPADYFEQGVSAMVADPKANPFDPLAGHKTVQYWTRLQTLVQAGGAGAGEALWFSVTNHLVGGAVSNAFIVKDGQLITPIARGEEPDGAIGSATLPGITRSVVIEQADELQIPVQKKMVSVTDVLEADELFLTNSSWQVLPVVKVEQQTIGDGKPGEVTMKLRRLVIDDIAERCDELGQ